MNTNNQLRDTSNKIHIMLSHNMAANIYIYTYILIWNRHLSLRRYDSRLIPRWTCWVRRCYFSAAFQNGSTLYFTFLRSTSWVSSRAGNRNRSSWFQVSSINKYFSQIYFKGIFGKTCRLSSYSLNRHIRTTLEIKTFG